MQVVTRFAPSPTGLLHLGHVYAAATAWRAARAATVSGAARSGATVSGATRSGGGRFLVRLEDIDPQRCRPAYADAILEDLAWLGFASDAPVRVQSAHLPEYRAVLDRLAARALVYPCFCSRADIAREIAQAAAAPHTPDGAPPYPGTCRTLSATARTARLAAGDPHAWRLDMQAALRDAPRLRFHEHSDGWTDADPCPFGDVVLARRDIPASYHLCVTHDDACQGITLVTRAADLKPATHLHVLLQHLNGWPTPAYAHHRLLRGRDGARLAKRSGAGTVRDLRDAGMSAADVVARAEEGSVLF
jgi:glutamyl-Q tRNA(Asp) synthetase